MFKSIYKVPNGKLIKISLERDGEIISNIKITGDFFLYPEDCIENIEDTIKGEKIENIKEKLNALVEEENIEFFGINVEAIIEAIKLAK